MKESKYWKEMYISADNNASPDSFIISKQPPAPYTDRDNIKISRGIVQEEYEEVCAFIEQHNRMSTGNTTLLPKEELVRYLSLPNTSVLMRSPNGKLMGLIISLELPVRNKNKTNEEIIVHGCTTFLNVHGSLRGHGLCMALIRGLIGYGFEDGHYCDYHMVAFELGANSIPLNSWFRPIRLERAKDLGFLYPGYGNPRNSRRNRLRYRTTIPKEHRYELVTEDDLEEGLRYYLKTVENENFAFWPDLQLWSQWVKSFPTYLVYKGENIVGITSLNTIYCRMEQTGGTGKVLFPIICNGDMSSVMPVLNTIAKENGYDIIYYHQHGLVTEADLESVNAIKTTTTMWFSLYNNQIKLTDQDIMVPLL